MVVVDIGKRFLFYVFMLVLIFSFQDVFAQEANDFYRLFLGVELSAEEMRQVIYP
ncbi:MAG TPA: hypothetical protein PKO34_00670 [Smithellaceae bacterium]|nr:hypothetical protein [Smithellaceae bacterium]